MLKVRRIGFYIVIMLVDFSVIFSIQPSSYAQCDIDWECQIVDSGGCVGQLPDLAFDASGRPAISYYDYTNKDLKFAYDRNCNGDFADPGEIVTVDGYGDIGLGNSLAFSTGPAISYWDNTNRGLKFAYDRNDDGDFTDPGEIIIVDNMLNEGGESSLAFDASGKPAISYQDTDNMDLKFAYDRNGDGDFADLGEIITVDSNQIKVLGMSLAFDTYGRPAIGYWDHINNDLKFAYDRNDDGDFADPGEIVTVDSDGDKGSGNSLAFSTGPAISYWDYTNMDLKFAYDRNDDGDFADPGEIITADSTGDVGGSNSLAFDASGRPAISYYDWTNSALKFAYDRNGDGDFAVPGEIITVDNDGHVGGSNSLAFDASGRPAISYYDWSSYEDCALKFAYYLPTPPPTPLPLYSIETNLKVEVRLSAQHFNDFIRNKGTVWVEGVAYDSVNSPLDGLGQAWVDAGDKYGINSIYLMAHAIQESGWGFSSIAQSKYNIYGYGAYDPDPAGGAYTFSNYEESIDKCAGWINTNYLTLGGKYYVAPTLRGMNVNYATDPNWGENIARLMNEFVNAIGWIQATVHSPTELRVYDSHGLVTGVVNGEERNEIPNSVYYDNTATILSPTDSYSYEVIGIGDGLYDMTVTKLVSQESTTFATTDIPAVTNMVHQYTINWDYLSVGQESVTVQIDSDGDGTLESTITADKDLTRAEYLSATGDDKGGVPIWLWPVVGGIGALLVLLAVVVYWRVVRKKPATQTAIEAEESHVTTASSDEAEDASPEDIRCPICGSETVIRTSQKGPNASRQFHVCSRYPACKGKLPWSNHV